MKKFLALFLVLTMLITSFAFLTSCDEVIENENATTDKESAKEDTKVTEESAKADPSTILAKASTNTYNNFFLVDSNAKKMAATDGKKCSLTLKLEGSDTFPVSFNGEIGTFSAVLYGDKENNYVASEIQAKTQNNDYYCNLYMNKNSAVINVSELEKALKVDFETLPEKFKTSTLFDMLELDLEENKEAADMLVELFKELRTNLNMTEADSIKLANEYLNLFLGEISEKEISVDGKDVKCIKIPLTFNAKNVKEYYKKSFERIKALDKLEEYESAKNETLQQIDDLMAGTELTVDVYIVKDTTTFAKIDLNATLGAAVTETEGESLNLKGEILFTDTAITLSGSTTVNGEKYSLTAEILKTTEKETTTFNYAVDVKFENDTTSATVKLVNGSVTYNEKTGALTFNAKVPEYEITCTINATFKVDGTKATFATSKLTVTEGNCEESFDFNMQIIFDAAPQIPAMPQNATDIINLSESDWEELASAFEEISKEEDDFEIEIEPGNTVDTFYVNDEFINDEYWVDEDYDGDLDDFFGNGETIVASTDVIIYDDPKDSFSTSIVISNGGVDFDFSVMETAVSYVSPTDENMSFNKVIVSSGNNDYVFSETAQGNFITASSGAVKN